ncbi:MAG: bifunctional diaminohydroxyphosphoribosylaminopyrimidine deaminase/5-amino-6-(5-phosphoribosylamino)uracil reductase RibD [Bacteroidales bacterium]|nr:MAG: bifunctional diaminohydroxyphosphoribosylaminopyrimidine deaminase/5-amino-6-(5-phosphoribosylamino)uracil reductase RibD [Bacteroidales bacterium]
MQRRKEIDEMYMARCLDLASMGRGYTYPNPLVGSVIIYRDSIIGEGYHREFGKPHSEVNAIEMVKDKSVLGESTMYVNLEPCCHSGKTPPCTDLIIRSGIRNIVIGSVDPNPSVSGSGIRQLENSGCNVTTGVLEQEGKNLNRSFFTYFEKKRPYIILKWAESADGYLDRIRTEDAPIGPNWITGELEKTLVHIWRAHEQAVMVGGGTVIIDNPRLTVRHWTGRQPLRISISREANFPGGTNLLDNQYKTLIYTEKILPASEALEYVQLDYNKDTIVQVLKDLYSREINSLIVEGGKKLLESFLNSGIWDEARVFKGDREFLTGIKAPTINSSPVNRIFLFQSELKIYRNWNHKR